MNFKHIALKAIALKAIALKAIPNPRIQIPVNMKRVPLLLLLCIFLITIGKLHVEWREYLVLKELQTPALPVSQDVSAVWVNEKLLSHAAMHATEPVLDERDLKKFLSSTVTAAESHLVHINFQDTFQSQYGLIKPVDVKIIATEDKIKKFIYLLERKVTRPFINKLSLRPNPETHDSENQGRELEADIKLLFYYVEQEIE